MATIIPPTLHRQGRLQPLFRAAAHVTYAGGLACTLTSSVLLLASAGFAGLAGVALAAGERLRERALALLSVGSPLAAAAFRAQEIFYARRKQGVALD